MLLNNPMVARQRLLSKIEAIRKEHWDGASEYARYLAKLKANPSSSTKGSEQLIRLGLLREAHGSVLREGTTWRILRTGLLSQLPAQLEQRAGAMFVTVAICTFNRAESLRRTLDSLAVMRVAGDLAWELIVVNNNSTDHTDAVIAEYRNRLPLRREFEPLQGHSNARNRAIAAARGEYIVWTDDDVIVGAGWLAAYAEAFRRWRDAAVFGGRIKPRYEPPVARWVAESERVLGGPFAIRDFGDEVQPLSVAECRIPYGANFAVRTAEQRVFRYDPDLGLAPDRRRYEDEVDVITRLLTSGTKGYWIPQAIVEHCIGRERQTVDYIAAFNEGWGETCAFRDADRTASSSFWFGIPSRIWPRLVVWGLLYRFGRYVSPAPFWVQCLQAYSYNRGKYRYWIQRRAQSAGR